MKVAFATRPACTARPNEDFIAATSRTVVVLDGAGVPEGVESGCVHGTPWFVTQLGAAVLHRSFTRPEQALADTLADAIAEVSALHADRCDLGHPGTPWAAVALLREHADTVESLVLADCTIVLDRSGGVEAIRDHRGDYIALAERTALQQCPADTGAEYAEAFSRLIVAQVGHRNSLGGFWVASSEPKAAHEAITTSTPRAQLRRAAVMTDGAARMVDPFHLASWPEVLALLERQGPSALIDRVRGAEDSDPERRRWRRSGQYDDATVAICRLEPGL